MATTPFKYQAPFPLGPDTTEYYLLTKDYVSVSEFEGTPVLKVEKEGLTAMANAAFRDVSFMLRRSHNEQVAKILSDPEASDNDKYVALTFLRNAEVAAKGVLPFCQDTGTAIPALFAERSPEHVRRSEHQMQPPRPDRYRSYGRYGI